MLWIKKYQKKFFQKNKITTPKYIKYKFDKTKLKKKKIIFIVKKKLKFPVVIKPINEGSSVDVYICEEKNLIKKFTKNISL